jgi:hypothetical protein
VRAKTTRIIILLVTVTVIVIVILASGWADDKAQPGSGGRVPVTYPGPDDSP